MINTGGADKPPAHKIRRGPSSSYPRGEDAGVYSALDLGTNNCRLLVARPTRNAFRVVDAFSRIVRLGEGVSKSGELSDEAVERTIEALKICAEKMRRRGVTHMRNVATQACRAANNCDIFVKRVSEETGITLDIIPAAEEARLAVLGCQALLDEGVKNAIVFDIGGGSTELIWVSIDTRRRPRILGWTSMPLGVVNLSEMFPADGKANLDGYGQMIEMVRSHLEPFEALYQMRALVDKGEVQMLGTSGTVTTLTSLHLNLPRYDRARVDGAVINTDDMKSLCAGLSGMDYEARSAHQCIGTDRAELIVAGCAILDAIVDLWPASRIRVADRGIREGMLLDLMSTNRARQKRQHYNRYAKGRRRAGGKGSKAAAAANSQNSQEIPSANE